ncbi:MAG: 2-C-methyl-D-erythritol 4-phosphate cytidylyltransferase [Oscillospiraceae bacterium]
MSGLFNRLFKSFRDSENRPFCTAIVAAAGSSSRMGGEDKLFAELDGIPVIAHTLMQLQESAYINEIVVVTQEKSIVPIADICAAYGIDKATKIVCGGSERLDSVLIGTLEASSEAEFLAVQDGARPLVTQEVISAAMEAAYKGNAAAPAVPVSDTIKTAENGFVTSTPDRSKLFAVQTPQVFRTEILKAALQNAKDKGLSVTDDCSAVEALGVAVALSTGSHENIKITTPVDITVAEAILDARG